MHKVKTSSGVSLVERMLQYSLVSQLPLRLTTQDEWHEFAPLCFLLVQALRPERILEVGTTAGDSYLALCQAVRLCNLDAMCVSVPDWRITAGYPELTNQFQEFRAYHEERYGAFSHIETEDSLLASADQPSSPWCKSGFVGKNV
jgi:hypothetical protein